MLGKVQKDIWFLSIATFLNRAAGFLSLFAAIFFTQTGMSRGLVTTALLTVGIAGIVGSLAGGAIADSVGKSYVLKYSTLINVVLLAILSQIDYRNALLLIGISALSVAASQAFVGPASALVAESSEGNERVTRFAFYRIFINVGSIVAPVIVGFIGRNHFDVLFFISAGVSALTLLILFIGRVGSAADRSGLAASLSQQADEDPETHYRLSAPNWSLVLIYFAMALAMIIYAQHQSAVPLQLNEVAGGVRLYSLLLIINPVIVIFLEYPLSYATKRLSAVNALSIGVLVMGAGVFIAGYFSTYSVIVIVGWVLFSIGECIFAPMSNSYVAELAPLGGQSKPQGQLAAFQATGSAIGPGIGSWLLFNMGGLTWLILLVITFFSCGLVLATKKRTKITT